MVDKSSVVEDRNISMQPKKRWKKILYWGVFSVSFVIMVWVVVMGVWENKQIAYVNSTMNPYFLLYEDHKQTVITEVRNFFLVSDATSYQSSKSSPKLSENVVSSLYGKSYDPYRFIGASKVSFVEVQYQLGDPLFTDYYVLLNFEKDGQTYTARVLVTVINGIIEDFRFV